MVLDTLRSYFTNIRQDYMVEEFHQVSGKTKCRFITDFADPVLKIAVQFPNTFWHNKEAYVDLQKNEKLKDAGWKVIIITNRAPSNQEIRKVVDQS